MKTIVTLLVLGIVTVAKAEEAPSSGLECDMTYSASGPLSSYKKTKTEWLVAGQELQGEAKVNDGDTGVAGTKNANSIQVSKTKINGADFWFIKILGSEKSVLGTISFPVDEESGMKATVPVNAVDDEDEDPTHFDTLEVVCKNTVFAG